MGGRIFRTKWGKRLASRLFNSENGASLFKWMLARLYIDAAVGLNHVCACWLYPKVSASTIRLHKAWRWAGRLGDVRKLGACIHCSKAMSQTDLKPRLKSKNIEISQNSISWLIICRFHSWRICNHVCNQEMTDASRNSTMSHSFNSNPHGLQVRTWNKKRRKPYGIQPLLGFQVHVWQIWSQTLKSKDEGNHMQHDDFYYPFQF